MNRSSKETTCYFKTFWSRVGSICGYGTTGYGTNRYRGSTVLIFQNYPNYNPYKCRKITIDKSNHTMN